MTTRVHSLGGLDYGRCLHELRRQVDSVIDARRRPASGVTVAYTGVMPLVHEAQEAILRDLIFSFLTATALVAIAMVFILRSVIGGLLAMLPNLFPSIVLLGLLGWLERPVNIGTVMTASVALGIAVDDTLHFVTRYRREIESGRSLRHALRRAFLACGPAMVQTTVIISLGLLVFSASKFVPTQRFGCMMFTLLLGALVGDLVLLPALLAGPFRRWFVGRLASGARTSPPE